MGSVVLALVDIARPRQYLKQVKMLEMNIDTLLQAAEYIERREREAEHGYASTLPTSQSQIIVTTKNQRLKTSSTKKGTGSRSTHNELEKNRRAHLRSCLENLKDLVPVGADSSRHTTLGLLNKAKHFIKNLEERDKKNRLQRTTFIASRGICGAGWNSCPKKWKSTNGDPFLSHHLLQYHPFSLQLLNQTMWT